MTYPSRHCEARSNRTEAGNDYCRNELTSSRSWPREGQILLSPQKYPKRLAAERLLCAHPTLQPAARPLPCKTNRTTGCNYFAPIRPIPSFCKNLLCPCSRTFPALFCPFSSEADLLRKTSDFNYVMVSLSKGRAQRPAPLCFDRLSMTPILTMSWGRRNEAIACYTELPSFRVVKT